MTTFDEDSLGIEPLAANSAFEARTIRSLARSAWRSKEKADALSVGLRRMIATGKPVAEFHRASTLIRAHEKDCQGDLTELAPLLTRCGYEHGMKVDCGGVVILFLVFRSGPYCLVKGRTLPDFPAEALDSLDAGLDGNSDRDELAERSFEYGEMIRSN